MKTVIDPYSPIRHFPVFEKGDTVHFQTNENQSNKIVEAKIVGIESFLGRKNYLPK